MTLRRAPVLLLAVGFATACQPWYRDNLLRGQRARHEPSTDALLDNAQRAYDAGQEQRAIEYARAAVVGEPSSGRAHLFLARYLLDAGRHDEARFVARRGVEVLGLAALRPILIEAYLADELTGDALDLVDPATVQGAAAAGIPHAADLARAELLSSTDPGQALALYQTWIGAHGVADHPILRTARDRILNAAWADHRINAVLSALLDRAYQEASAGNVNVALTLYSQAFRQVLGVVPARHAQSFLYVAAAVKDPAVVDPLAYALAAQGDTALAAGHLGRAIHLYRRVVALAPWWSAAFQNLAILHALAGRTDEARLAGNIAQRLQANLSHPAKAPAPHPAPTGP